MEAHTEEADDSARYHGNRTVTDGFGEIRAGYRPGETGERKKIRDRQIRECMDHLIEAIRNSSEYSSYRKSLEALDRFPGLSDKIMELRSKTIELYHEENAGDLMEDSEELGNEFAELEKMPEISEFLEAEEEEWRDREREK